MRFFRNFIFTALACWLALGLGGCSKVMEQDYRELDYGYVQFKLYKAGTKADKIDYLRDVAKLKVTLRYDGNLISQTLIVGASDNDAAEFGLRSDKLKLLKGDYSILTYVLYDKLDNVLNENVPSEDNSSFTVLAGGLVQHELQASVVERGKVKFSLIKDISGRPKPETKAAIREYTFDEIKYACITVKTGNTLTDFNMLPVEFSIHFEENDNPTDGYQTSSFVCDSLLSLRAGDYLIESYTLYDASRNMLEANSDIDVDFSVEDNKTTEVDVPVKLNESDEYIKDYYALYEIWKSLGGEDWYYNGQDYPVGSNWDFNKDPDLWGDQPGVSLHSNGRVALINLSGFGFYGHMPEAIGQLTQLVELYLGTHNDSNQSAYDPNVVPADGPSGRMERHRKYMRSLHPATPMSEPVARALAEHDIYIPETEFYKVMAEDQLIDPYTGGTRIQPKDMVHGKLTNGLISLPSTIGKLTKLEQLLIANSTITSLPAEMSKLKSLTDLEIYNCPEMTEFPMVVAEMPSLVLLNLANNRQWSAEEAYKGIKGLAEGPSAEKIQILYFNENSLEVVPKEITNMKKLGLIDFSSNKIHTIESAWGNDIKPVQLYLDNNELSSFPVEDGVFCFMEDAETFSVRNNKFTEFPDIFDAKSMFSIVSVDFSYNRISGFPKNFKGIKVETLSLANNPELTEYPMELAESNSNVAYVNLRGCNVNSIPEGAFTYENSINLTSLDLSYNDLDDLPKDMHAGNLPYLYGVELSYNRFKEFPWEPLDSQYLTVFAIRSQRDERGERCLSDWPEGIYNHRGLRGFYIGSNNLKKIDDTISTICYYLDISDNPNIVFDASDICYAIQTGAYILIYDKTQNILNCDILLN